MRRLVREKRGGDTIFCKDFSDAELIRMKMGGFGCRCCCYCGSGMPVESGDFFRFSNRSRQTHML